MSYLRLLAFTVLIAWDTSRSIYRLMRRGFVPVVLIAVPADERQPGPYFLGLLDIEQKDVCDVIVAAAECITGGRPSVVEKHGP